MQWPDPYEFWKLCLARYVKVHFVRTKPEVGASNEHLLSRWLHPMDMQIKKVQKDWMLLSMTESGSRAAPSEPQPAVINLEEDEQIPIKQELQEESDSDSDALTTSSSEDEVGASLTGAARRLRLPTIPDELKLIQHTKYKTLHLMEKQNNRILLCGRAVVDGRYAQADEARFDTPCCHQCWKHKHEYER